MRISTPCINLCKLDDATGLCRGCRRTRAEIMAWGHMAEGERLAIMATLARRSTQRRSTQNEAVKVPQADDKQE